MSSEYNFKYPKKNHDKLIKMVKESKYYFGLLNELEESEKTGQDVYVLNHSCMISIHKKGYGCVDWWLSAPKVTINEVSLILRECGCKSNE